MGFYDYDGGSSYSPMTDFQTPVDAFGSVPPAPPPEPSIWDRIVKGVAPLMQGVSGDGNMGVDNKDQPNLQMPQLVNSPVRPPGNGPAPQDAFGSLPGVTSPVANPPLPPVRPDIQQAQVPLPTPAPGQPQLPTGMDLAGDKPFLPSDAKMTQQNGMQVPVIGSAPPGPPLPLGQKLASAESPAPPAPPQKLSFLQNLITGGKPSGTLGLQQMAAGLGKGLSGIQGNSGLANFARGMGGGISGAQSRGDKQFDQATQDFNNHMKMMLTGSTVEKNEAYIAFQQERQKWLGLGSKGSGGDSWRNTPYGRQISIDTQVESTYRAGLGNISRDNSMNYEQKEAARQNLKKEREEERLQWYGRHGIDPKTGAPGYSEKNPIDTSKVVKSPFIPGKDLNEQSPEFQREFRAQVPPGAAYRLPGDPPNTVRWQRPAAPNQNQQAAARAATPQHDDE